MLADSRLTPSFSSSSVASSVNVHTQLTSHNSYTTHLLQLIFHNSSQPLISSNSSYTTHLTQLTSHNSSHTTHLTHFILHTSSHTAGAALRVLLALLLRGRRSTLTVWGLLARAWSPLGSGCNCVAGAALRALGVTFAWQAQHLDWGGVVDILVCCPCGFVGGACLK